MTILYFGSYKPSYPRNKIIIDGLRANGVTVIECNDRTPSIPVRFVKLFIKYFKIREDFDLMVVGFPGQEAMFLAKLICRKPIVFDVFTSHYMGYILDRKYFSTNSLRAKYYRFMDRWSCRLADMVFLDTQAHIKYFVKEFGLNSSKFRRIWLGANPELHRPMDIKKGGVFSVLFWGGFIPLQGVDVIVKAARILKDEDIQFNLIGKGQTFEECRAIAGDSQKINFLGKVSDEYLVESISNSDICLGAFSNGEKADITIQNKIFEAMASRKPMITMKTTALRELLNEGQGVLLCEKNNPEDLAAKILKLKNDSELRQKVAEDGYKLFLDKLTPEKIGQDLIKVLNEVLKK